LTTAVQGGLEAGCVALPPHHPPGRGQWPEPSGVEELHGQCGDATALGWFDRGLDGRRRGVVQHRGRARVGQLMTGLVGLAVAGDEAELHGTGGGVIAAGHLGVTDR
jgi:hypothetical protein